MSVFREIFFARRRLISNNFMPFKTIINITGRCNLGCVFCEKSNYKSSQEISFDDLKKILNFSKDNKMSVLLSGGEPFLHTKIWDILEYCIKINLKVSIVTNAALLSNLSDEKQHLLNNSISIMSISIDSPVPEEHDRIRGVKGTFDRANGYILNVKRKHKIAITTVLSVDFQNVLPMLDFAAAHKISINFQPVIFESNFPELAKIEWKNNIQRKMPLMTDNIKNLRKYYAYARKNGIVSNLYFVLFFIEQYYKEADSNNFFFDKILKNFMCFVPLNSLIINECGEIMPCVFLRGKTNIHQDNLYEAWLSSALEFRASWKKGKRYPACRSCSCHFAENLRNNIITQPITNFKYLGWFLNYYLFRLIKKEGRVHGGEV